MSAGSYHVKLFRALQHLETLDAEIQGWLETEPYSVVDQFEPQQGMNVVRAQITSQPPSEWGALVGDVVHNLRSALDHLAYALAESYTGAPLPDDIARSSEFPIFDSAADFSERKRNGRPTARSGLHKIRGVDPSVQAIIEGLQPYHGGDHARLAVLRDLSNRDKHREFVLSPFLRSSDIGGRIVGSALVDRVEMSRRGPVEDGTVLASYRVYPRPGQAYVDMEFHFSFDVAFEEGPPGYGAPVSELLRDIRAFLLSDIDSNLRARL